MAKGKKPKWTGKDFKRARKAAESLYYYRINKPGEQGPLFQDYRGPIPPRDIQAAEILLANTPVFWQCVSVTYCKNSQSGKEYRLWGFAKTEQQLRIIKEPLDPVVQAAQQVAEEGANTRHIVGRSFILAPWSKVYNDLTPLIRKHAKEFELSEEDLIGITDYLSTDYDYMSYESEPLPPIKTLDDQIAELI